MRNNTSHENTGTAAMPGMLSLTAKEQCGNLLVPVCLSASHIAYGSIRMEPVFMVLGQSAALAAVEAIDSHTAVQDIEIRKLQAQLIASH